MIKKRVNLEELEQECRAEEDYNKLVDYVRQLIKKGEITPVPQSGGNGKKPALYQRYMRSIPKEDTTQYEEELKNSFSAEMDVSYYLHHLEQYKKDRVLLLKLDAYLKNHKEEFGRAISENERSFAIWQREKYLSGQERREKDSKMSYSTAKQLLKHVNMSKERLKIYETTEPLAYFSASRKTPQNLLIIENLDTFYTFRRYLLQGKQNIFGMEFGTLIYGGGQGIGKKMKEREISGEPYMLCEENRYYYLGDIDFAGVEIYVGLRNTVKEECIVEPFVEGYRRMLKKAVEVYQMQQLPETKKGQREYWNDEFFAYFSQEEQRQMRELLIQRYYVPQEILNSFDLE